LHHYDVAIEKRSLIYSPRVFLNNNNLDNAL